MSERRRLITVIAVSAVAVVIATAGAAAIGFLADGSDETVVTQEPETGAEDPDESGDTEDEPEGEPTDGPASDDGENATEEDEMNGELFQAGGKVLPKPMGGQEAIDELGENLEKVAEKNNRTVEELRELLLRDKTVKITPSGFLLYVDTATPNIPDNGSD